MAESTAAATRPSKENTRLPTALFSVALTVCLASTCSRQAGSDGRTAVWLVLLNLVWLGGCAVWTQDRALGALLAGAGSFGVTELLADLLCVRCTGTLDYSPSHSTLVLASPWWMPLLWLVVAVQIGVVGAGTIRHFGYQRGLLLGGLAGASLIPLYEFLAWRAGWWQYRNCLQIWHVPVYIVVAEAVIGAGLALLGHKVSRGRSWHLAAGLGGLLGLTTILGGIVGWGAVEFICRGARPSWEMVR